MIRITAENDLLTGLDFVDEKEFDDQKDPLPVMKETKKWLDLYFSGKDPGFIPSLKAEGTLFQKEVWEILLKIPYGETMSYGGIAVQIAEKRGIKKMSAQAVGQAVGNNPVSLIIPCHRVIGKDGSLTGYASGIGRKRKLLELEKKT